MKIAVLDDYQKAFHRLACPQRLNAHQVVVFHENEKDPEKLVARLNDVEAVILTQERTAVPRQLLDRLPDLRIIAQTGSHREHIDVSACTEKGIVVAAVEHGPSYSTAELTWALILASRRHIAEEVRQLRAGVWQSTVGTVVRGTTLAVYGLGQIGSAVAQVGRAFGMDITCWGRASSKEKAIAAGYHVPDSRQAFFETADILSLHVPLSSETTGLVTAADLARMKPSALLVNTSRARLIEDGALVAALRKGRPGFAAVDVFEDEPVLAGNHPLLGMPNVICTPHLGGIVWETFEFMYGHAIDNILAFASNKPTHVYNPDVLARLRR
ncbi:MAG: D-2-hydroxyacid dehydrogenase family protein [Betaproteobacteria bacterium]|nr:D-2-hydroxyacid dehydrogenase family protein [Betaproteobacteria bacterium]